MKLKVWNCFRFPMLLTLLFQPEMLHLELALWVIPLQSYFAVVFSLLNRFGKRFFWGQSIVFAYFIQFLFIGDVKVQSSKPQVLLANLYKCIKLPLLVSSCFSIMSLPQLGLDIDVSSMKALRAGRVLRPLKLVSGIPSMFFFILLCKAWVIRSWKNSWIFLLEQPLGDLNNIVLQLWCMVSVKFISE